MVHLAVQCHVKDIESEGPKDEAFDRSTVDLLGRRTDIPLLTERSVSEYSAPTEPPTQSYTTLVP